MSDGSPASDPQKRRRVVIWGVIRALLTMAALVAVYFVAPLDGLRIIPLWLSLSVACVLLVVVSAWEIRRIATSPYPALRAVEAWPSPCRCISCSSRPRTTAWRCRMPRRSTSTG